MRSRRVLFTLSGVLAVCLVGCAPQAQPDWTAAEAAAQEFEGAASVRDGFLGSGTLRVEDGSTQLSDESEVVLSYASDVRVDGVTIACFGEGTARFGVTVRVGSSWIGAKSVDIECDGSENLAGFDDPIEAVNALSFNGELASGTGGVLVAAVSGLGPPADLGS